MEKYIIKVNGKEYHSYKELCDDLDINFVEFMRFKHENPKMHQLELIRHFYEKALMSMSDGSIFVDTEKRKKK